jgi:hypothetical protein
MIDQLAASASARRGVDMVVFFDDDARGGTGPIAKPGKLAGRDLPYYVAHKGQFGGLWDGFPTILGCTRAVCRRKSPADIGLR